MTQEDTAGWGSCKQKDAARRCPKEGETFCTVSWFSQELQFMKGGCYVIYLPVSCLACIRLSPLDGDTASCLISMRKRHEERWKWPQPQHNIINCVGEITLSTLSISILMSLHCLDLYSSLVRVNGSMVCHVSKWEYEDITSVSLPSPCVSVAADVHVSCRCCCPLLGWARRQTVLMNHPSGPLLSGGAVTQTAWLSSLESPSS